MTKPKVLLVLYKGGQHAKDQPKLLGTLENELGIRKFVEDHGYELVTTDDKDGSGSVVDKELPDTEIIITTPFFPAYITRERIAKAPKLKIAITAGVGLDHIDLNAANERKISVLEVTGSNVVSVAEHAVMTMLVLVRNYGPAHAQVATGQWDIAGAAKHSYDLEGKVVATIGAGRIGYRILERLVPFNPKRLLYYDYQDLPKAAFDKLNKASELYNDNSDIVERVDSLELLVSQADIVTINCPLHESTKGLVDKKLLAHFKDGAILVNTARGAICNEHDVAEAVKAGKLIYGGDVWNVQPAPKDHPWRSFKHVHGQEDAMTPHVSGTSLDAQARYASGVRDILGSYFSKKYDYRPADIIVIDGGYLTRAYGQRDAK